MNRTIRRLATLLATATILLATVGAAPAAAASRSAAEASASADIRAHNQCAPLRVIAAASPTVESWKAVGLCEVDRRLETLAVLGSRVDHASGLTDAHQAALKAILDDTTAGLRALRVEIGADTTIAALREDIGRIVKDFRVYLLVARQVHLVVAADAVDATVVQFGAAIETLEGAIDAAEAAGKDVANARALLAGVIDDVGAADAAVDKVADEVLELTPADWNDGSAQPVLRAARKDIATARTHLREALTASKQVIAEIR